MNKYEDKTPEECEEILELFTKTETTDEEEEKIHQFLGNPASDEDSKKFFSEFRNGYA